MILETLPQVARLTPGQKLVLAGELWDELTAMEELFPVCPETVNLLEARYADYVRNPATAVSWDDFKRQFETTS